MGFQRQDFEKLFEDLGGEEGLQRILTVMYKKFANDILIGFFFSGKDLDHIILQQKSFIMRSMGKSLEYRGKTPASAHLELPPILKGHFDRRLQLVRETLSEFGISNHMTEVWVEFEDVFRQVVVTDE